MAEPIRQSLFRFKTMRAPELLSEEEKANYFITHFDSETGVFFEAVAEMEPTDIREEILDIAADEFTDKKTRDELVALDADLYELGRYLLKNRNVLTVAEATTAVGTLTPLSAPNEELVWDNLFYQTITNQSGYAREACLVLILANHFVTNFVSIPTNDEAMQRWANSRVVMPLTLFGFDQSFLSVKAPSDDISSFPALNEQMQIAETNLTKDQINTLKEELAAYKSIFMKTNNALEKTAIETYNAAVKAARDEATTEDYVDQFSDFTFKRYTDYEAPTYTYVRPAEIDPDPMGEFLSAESMFIAGRYGLLNSRSFEEFENELEKIATSLNKEIFERSSFKQEKMAIEGNLISKCDLDKRFMEPYGYMIKMVERSTGSYSLIMTIDTGENCEKMSQAVTTTDVVASPSFTTFKSGKAKGIVTIDLTNGQAIDITEEEYVTVSSEVLFDSGIKLGIESIAVTIGGYFSGNMTRIVVPSAQPDLKIPSGFGLRRLGITDYRVLEQTLCCYVPGEVSHIENVMAREYKERSTRRLRRQEDTTTTSSSSERENMTDTSTTSRFDIQKEVSAVLSNSIEQSRHSGFNAGSSGSTSIPLVGEVDFTLGADFSTDFSTTNSMEMSNNEATTFAKDVTEKATQRIVSKVSEERVTKMIEEFEEKNQHGFDNRKGAEHISGVYRWVDQIYKNQVRNYGKRLLYEFMIPEPGEFHLIAKASAVAQLNTTPLVKPLDPRSNAFGSLAPIRNSAHILESNYSEWAAAYGAVVIPPPQKYITLGKSLSRPDDGSAWYTGKTVTGDIQIPDGYEVYLILASIGASDDADWNYIDLSAGGITRRYYGDIMEKAWFADSDHNSELKWVKNSIAIGAHFMGHQSGTATFNVWLACTHRLFKEWQLDTFNAIMDAYHDRLSEYNNALAELEARQGGVSIDNPAYYRQIENTVLKKNCITYLTGSDYPGKNFKVGSHVVDNQVNTSAAMDRYATVVKFFEQAFEWDLMNYQFYPFYWGTRSKWEELYTLQNSDALFKAFLSSGMARVIVSVRPGFEEAVMYFIRTGKIWNGGDVPMLDDPMYLSIVEELAKPEFVIEETWETRVPSTLTVIQASTIALEADGLPCYCNSEELPEENIVKPEVNPLTGLEVFIEGDTGE